MEKRPKKDDKFTVTEVGALIEAMRSEFKPYLEIIPGMQEKLNATFEQVGKNTEDIQLIKLILGTHTEDIKSIKDILKEHDSILKNHTELLNRVLEELKSKVDRRDFELLEKKVASLTS